jgi:RNA polymerase primary sigma factor
METIGHTEDNSLEINRVDFPELNEEFMVPDAGPMMDDARLAQFDRIDAATEVAGESPSSKNELVPETRQSSKRRINLATEELQDLSALQIFKDQAAKIPRLTPQREVELGKLIEKGDADAKRKMIEASLLLVADFTKEFEGQGVSRLDLIQAGSMSLFSAAEKFNWRMGYRFSTYAKKGIRAAMQAEIASQGQPIATPVGVYRDSRRVGWAYNELAYVSRAEPSAEDIGIITGLDIERVKDILEISRLTRTTSFNDPIDNEDTTTELGETIAASGLSVEEEVEANIMRTALKDTMKRVLEYPERKVLEERCGLNGKEPKSQSTLAKMRNVARSAIRQVEAQAIEKLQKAGLEVSKAA